MNIAQLVSAFAGGVLSFFTPCIFPLLPGYISMISGVSASHAHDGNAPGRAGLAALCFVAGFATLFSLMGASASALGELMADHTRALSVLSGLVLIFFGLHTAGVFNLRFLQHEKRFSPAKIKPGFAGAFMMGAVFGMGWSPCIGPILAGFLAMAATQGTALKGLILLFVYSIGLGLPFIIAGFAVGHIFGLMSKYRKFVRGAEIAAGVLMICIGVVFILSARAGFLHKILPI
jgi:cytochrome c-type biogenesis protein